MTRLGVNTMFWIRMHVWREFMVVTEVVRHLQTLMGHLRSRGHSLHLKVLPAVSRQMSSMKYRWMNALDPLVIHGRGEGLKSLLRSRTKWGPMRSSIQGGKRREMMQREKKERHVFYLGILSLRTVHSSSQIAKERSVCELQVESTGRGSRKCKLYNSSSGTVQ